MSSEVRTEKCIIFSIQHDLRTQCVLGATMKGEIWFSSVSILQASKKNWSDWSLVIKQHNKCSEKDT